MAPSGVDEQASEWAANVIWHITRWYPGGKIVKKMLPEKPFSHTFFITWEYDEVNSA